MTRRVDPERIYVARRDAAIARLEGLGTTSRRAEELVAAWEREGAGRGLDRLTAAFWQRGDEWLEAARSAGRRR